MTAYTVERPDGQWSILLVNKDQNNDQSVRITFADPVARHDRFFSGKVDRVVFGPAEYQWHADPVPAGGAVPTGEAAEGGDGETRRRLSGHAAPDGPPSISTVRSDGPDTRYELPKASIVVLRGKIW